MKPLIRANPLIRAKPLIRANYSLNRCLLYQDSLDLDTVPYFLMGMNILVCLLFLRVPLQQ